MAHSREWSSYEGKPAGGDFISSGDDEIRNTKVDIRERMLLNHVWNGNTAIDGRHIIVHLVASGLPTKSDGWCILSGSAASLGTTELFVTTSTTPIQITASSYLNLDVGRLTNETYLVSASSDDSSNINILRVNTLNQIQFETVPICLSSPTAIYGLANRNFTDITYATTGSVGGRTLPLTAGQAVGTTDIAGGGAEADMTDMSITMTTHGTRLLVMFAAPMMSENNYERIKLYINIDGANKRQHDVEFTGYGAEKSGNSVGFQHLETGLVADDMRIIKVRWNAAATCHQYGSSMSERILTAIDID